MKGLLSGLIIAAFGFLLMAFSYFNYQHDPGSGPWKDAVMYLGKGQPGSEAGEFEYVTRPVRLLDMPGRAESFVPLARSFSPEVEKSYCVSFQEKVFLYSGLADDFTSQMLESGRLPSPGADEAVAGFNAVNQSKVTGFGSAPADAACTVDRFLAATAHPSDASDRKSVYGCQLQVPLPRPQSTIPDGRRRMRRQDSRRHTAGIDGVTYSIWNSSYFLSSVQLSKHRFSAEMVGAGVESLIKFPPGLVLFI